MAYEELLSLMQTRRTIRALKTDPIPDESVEKILEAARWAPTGFNMQPNEFIVVKDEALRKEIKRVVDDYKNNDFYPMEATREEWQGHPWTMATHGTHDLPLAPVFIVFGGDTRRRIGLPMAARYSHQKGDSIFESSLLQRVHLRVAGRSLAGPGGVPHLRGQVPEAAGAWSSTSSTCRTTSGCTTS